VIRSGDLLLAVHRGDANPGARPAHRPASPCAAGGSSFSGSRRSLGFEPGHSLRAQARYFTCGAGGAGPPRALSAASRYSPSPPSSPRRPRSRPGSSCGVVRLIDGAVRRLARASSALLAGVYPAVGRLTHSSWAPGGAVVPGGWGRHVAGIPPRLPARGAGSEPGGACQTVAGRRGPDCRQVPPP
jgi:hypothetical protein